MQTDGPGFSLCAALLELSGPVFWSNTVRTAEEDGGPEYSRLERDGELSEQEGTRLNWKLS